MVLGAWLLGAAVITWTQGLSKGQFPEPFRFLDLSITMVIASGLQRLNPTVGGLFAWGMLLALMLRGNLFQDLVQMTGALTAGQTGQAGQLPTQPALGATLPSGGVNPSARTVTPPGVPNPGGNP